MERAVHRAEGVQHVPAAADLSWRRPLRRPGASASAHRPRVLVADAVPPQVSALVDRPVPRDRRGTACRRRPRAAVGFGSMCGRRQHRPLPRRPSPSPRRSRSTRRTSRRRDSRSDRRREHRRIAPLRQHRACAVRHFGAGGRYSTVRLPSGDASTVPAWSTSKSNFSEPARRPERREVDLALPGRRPSSAVASHACCGAEPGQSTLNTPSPSSSRRAPGPHGGSSSVFETFAPSFGDAQRNAAVDGAAALARLGPAERGRDGRATASASIRSRHEQWAACSTTSMGVEARRRRPRPKAVTAQRADQRRWADPSSRRWRDPARSPAGHSRHRVGRRAACSSQPATRNRRRSRHAAPAVAAARTAPSRMPSSDTWSRSTP